MHYLRRQLMGFAAWFWAQVDLHGVDGGYKWAMMSVCITRGETDLGSNNCAVKHWELTGQEDDLAMSLFLFYFTCWIRRLRPWWTISISDTFFFIGSAVYMRCGHCIQVTYLTVTSQIQPNVIYNFQCCHYYIPLKMI